MVIVPALSRAAAMSGPSASRGSPRPRSRGAVLRFRCTGHYRADLAGVDEDAIRSPSQQPIKVGLAHRERQVAQIVAVGPDLFHAVCNMGLEGWSRVLWVTLARILIPISKRKRSAHCRCLSLRRAGGHSSAGERALLFPPRRRDHGRSRLVAILATADLGSFDCGGSHRADPQSRTHGRPNTVVRSVREGLVLSCV